MPMSKLFHDYHMASNNHLRRFVNAWDNVEASEKMFNLWAKRRYLPWMRSLEKASGFWNVPPPEYNGYNAMYQKKQNLLRIYRQIQNNLPPAYRGLNTNERYHNQAEGLFYTSRGLRNYARRTLNSRNAVRSSYHAFVKGNNKRPALPPKIASLIVEMGRRG